jgi:hypothetical protein
MRVYEDDCTYTLRVDVGAGSHLLLDEGLDDL